MPVKMIFINRLYVIYNKMSRNFITSPICFNPEKEIFVINLVLKNIIR